MKTTESGGVRGFDAGKKVKGRKRHIVVDTLGLLVGVVVHAADIQDRDGAPAVLKSILERWPWLRHVFADGGYAGPKLRDALQTTEPTIDTVFAIQPSGRFRTRFQPGAGRRGVQRRAAARCATTSPGHPPRAPSGRQRS